MKWILTQNKDVVIRMPVKKISRFFVARMGDYWQVCLTWEDDAYDVLGTYHVEGQAEEIIEGIVGDIEYNEDKIIYVPQCWCDKCQSKCSEGNQ